MGFWREVDLEWKGRTYSVVPDFNLLAQIERKGELSVMRVTSDVYAKNPQITKMAFVMASMLSAAECKDVSLDEITAALMGADDGEATALYHTIADALVPKKFGEDEGNEEGTSD